MEMNEKLVQAITQAVLEQLQKQPSVEEKPVSLEGKTRMRPKHSYEGYPQAKQGTDPKEIVIGVGAAFQEEITKTISDLPLEAVIENVRAGIEEEGIHSRVVKVLDTSDVAFMALESAKLAGSGIGIGIQSKGTTVIHQKDLYPLTNLELFPQAPSITPSDWKERGKICKGRKGNAYRVYQRSHGSGKISGEGGIDAYHGNRTAGSGEKDYRMGGQEMSNYPLGKNEADSITSKTGKKLSQITLEEVKKGNVQADDIKISKEMLHRQGQVAREADNPAMAGNFERAAELVDVPDEVILKMYNKLRPNRCTKMELVEMAKELLEVYHAPHCAKLVLEAAEIYEKRGITR